MERKFHASVPELFVCGTLTSHLRRILVPFTRYQEQTKTLVLRETVTAGGFNFSGVFLNDVTTFM